MWIVAALIIGKWFFDFAKKNGKNPVAFALVGVMTYTVAEWIIGFIVRFFLAEYYYNWWFSAVSVPFSFFVVWIVYSYLKSTWQPKSRSKHKKKFDNRVEKSSTVAPVAAASESKVNLEKPSQSEALRPTSKQSTGRYNKNER